MRRIFRIWTIVLLLAVALPGAALPVFGATEEMGFVEYQTEASINFEEIVEVVLVNEETSHYYTHRLYRINDYVANFSVPLGTYSVSARVITEYEEELRQYDVVCLTEKVVVANQNIAVPIQLRVDEFALGDVSGGDGGEADPTEPTVDDWTTPGDDGETEDISGNLPGEDDGLTVGPSDPDVGDAHEGESVWGSLFVSLFMLGVGSVVVWFLYRKKED